MADVIALINDLFFQARVSETARQAGVSLQFVGSSEAFAAAATNGARLFLVDLNAGPGAIEALERLKSSGNLVPVVAFLSHVQTELAERARAAGCGMVLPRSRFTVELPAILAGAREPARPSHPMPMEEK